LVSSWLKIYYNTQTAVFTATEKIFSNVTKATAQKITGVAKIAKPATMLLMVSIFFSSVAACPIACGMGILYTDWAKKFKFEKNKV
jgi:hypothetical protein